MIKRFFLLSGLCMFLSVSAQKTHTVIKGDNPYNISKKYGITIDELNRLNPKFKDGKLAIGDILTVKAGNTAVTKPVSSNSAAPSSTKTGKIYLQPKQTIYGITKQYKISEADLRKLNPDLDSHTKIGDEITLPIDSIKKYGGTQATIAPTKPVEVPVETALGQPGRRHDIGNAGFRQAVLQEQPGRGRQDAPARIGRIDF